MTRLSRIKDLCNYAITNPLAREVLSIINEGAPPEEEILNQADEDVRAIINRLDIAKSEARDIGTKLSLIRELIHEKEVER